MNIYWYEAPPGETLPGLVDPVPAPRTIRVITRPGMRRLYPLLGDVLKSLGADTEIPIKGKQTATPSTLAAAWAFVDQVDTIYLGEAQDLTPAGLDEVLDFTHRLGANVHLIFATGTLHQHAPVLQRRGGTFRQFSDLPFWVTQPPTIADLDETVEATTVMPREVPGDDWVTFRSAYRAIFDPSETQACDRLYAAALRASRECDVASPDDVARLVARVWNDHRCHDHRRLVAVRAIQAGLFLQGWNVKAEMGHLTRYVTDRYFNPLGAGDYLRMARYADPWRTAATVLHAHHVPISVMRETPAREVGADGSFPGADVRDPDARRILAAQRWTQLIGADAPDPPFIAQSEHFVRAGIKKVASSLNLPMQPQWRRAGDKRYEQRVGISMETIR